ncbi:MAG: colicin E3/pyocin S6 family cytotoxin [Ilumatobacteraceae bacterium]
MSYVPIPKDCFIRHLERYFYQGRHIWISNDRRFRFTWDRLHGEVEVFSRRGRHLGVMDCNSNLIGSAVKGRWIDV